MRSFRLPPPLARAVAVTVGLLALALMTSAPAQAHAALVSSDPAAGATLAGEPPTVTMTFNENVGTPAYVVVKAPDGSRVEDGKPKVVDHQVTQEVKPSGYAGSYTMSYRVVSTDGHPIEGTIGYRVSSGKRPAKRAAPVANESFTHRHGDHLLWGGAGIVVAAALLLWPRRHRDEEEAG